MVHPCSSWRHPHLSVSQPAFICTHLAFVSRSHNAGVTFFVQPCKSSERQLSQPTGTGGPNVDARHVWQKREWISIVSTTTPMQLWEREAEYQCGSESRIESDEDALLQLHPSIRCAYEQVAEDVRG